MLQETVAALIGVGEESEGRGDTAAAGEMEAQIEQLRPPDDLDGVPIFDDRPIDFSGGAGLDGMPMVRVESGGAGLDDMPMVCVESGGAGLDGMPMVRVESGGAGLDDMPMVRVESGGAGLDGRCGEWWGWIG